MWRRGPNGAGTLCNACGVKWKNGKILVGVSSGGNLVAAMTVAEKLKEGVVVTIFCDSAAKYLSEDFWHEIAPPSFEI